MLVNPDAEGKATGVLYEDARDGFEYREFVVEELRLILRVVTDGYVVANLERSAVLYFCHDALDER